MSEKILSQLVDQFKNRHNRLPGKIVIHPVAMAALALKQSVAQKWNGIPVECREIQERRPIIRFDDGSTLGITVVNGALRGFDLA